MNTKTSLATALSLAISTCLLAACGGGGAMVRLAPVSSASDPPPPAPTAEPCSSPVTGDCTVNVAEGTSVMTGGRQSNHALIKTGKGLLGLGNNDPSEFRFGGGTTIEDGNLSVYAGATLNSNVIVQTAGELRLFNNMVGNLDNRGTTELWGRLAGNVVNSGVLVPGSTVYEEYWPARIEGNFSQTQSGTLVAVVGASSGGFLSVNGRADIDGTLKLVQYTDDWGPYALPAAPLNLQVLHADGGVFGQFAQWTSPGLFVSGALRYLANDVYFDITAISATQAMAAAPSADALTLRSAAHFDAALGNAGKWARSGATLGNTQRQFLASVGAIQHIRDYGQAVRTFDSLSGSGYAAAVDTLLQQAATPAPELLARVDNVHRGIQSGTWSAQSAMLASGAGAFSGQRGGFDRWLDERTLLGGSFGWSDGGLRFDRSGGSARDRSPQLDIYWRHNGGGNSYLFGDIGYSRHSLNLTRQIDLGVGRQATGAWSNLDVMRAYIEAGRDFRIGQARLTPFGAVSYAVLRGAGFAEQGSTGFELVAQPATHQRLYATTGVRLGSEWRSGSGRWTTVHVAAGYRPLLQAQDSTRVAFTGTPDATFALAGMPRQGSAGWMQMSLATGGARWNWSLNYDRQASDEALSLSMRLEF